MEIAAEDKSYAQGNGNRSQKQVTHFHRHLQQTETGHSFLSSPVTIRSRSLTSVITCNSGFVFPPMKLNLAAEGKFLYYLGD
jgi:hypothetical protein